MGRASLCLGIALLLTLACGGGGGDSAVQNSRPASAHPWTRTIPFGDGRFIYRMETDARGRALLYAQDGLTEDRNAKGWALAYGVNGESLWAEGGSAGVHIGGPLGSFLLAEATTRDGGAWTVLQFEDGTLFGHRAMLKLQPDGTSNVADQLPLPEALGLGLDLLALPDGGGVMSSTLWRPDAEPGVWTAEPWVCRFDASGALRWGTSESPGVSIPLASGSSFHPEGVVAGVDGAVWTYGIETSGDGSEAWRVTAFDGEGRRLRSDVRPVIYGPRDSHRANLLPAPDGGYFFGYSDHERPGTPLSVWIGRFDATGHPVWSEDGKEGRRFRGAEGDAFAAGLAATPEGRIVAAGWTASPGARQVWFRCLDAAGQDLWGFDGVPVVEGAGPVSTAGIYLAPKLDAQGNAYLFGTVNLVNPASGDAWLLKLDPRGRSVWNRGFDRGVRFGSDGWDEPLELAPTPDGGCLVLGNSHWFGPGNWGLWWLSRVDATGTVDFSGVRDPRPASARPMKTAFGALRGGDPRLPLVPRAVAPPRPRAEALMR